MKTIELAGVVACLVLAVQAGGPGGDSGGQGNGKTGSSDGGNNGGSKAGDTKTGDAPAGVVNAPINARRWLLRRSGPGGVVGAQTSTVGPVNQGPTVQYGSGTIQGNNYGNQAAPGRGGDGYVDVSGSSATGGPTGGNKGGDVASKNKAATNKKAAKGGKRRRSLLPRGTVNLKGATANAGNTGGNIGGASFSQGGGGGKTGPTISGSKTGDAGEGGKQTTSFGLSMPMMGARSLLPRGEVNLEGATANAGNTGGNRAGPAVSQGGYGGGTGPTISNSQTGKGGKGGAQSTDVKFSMPIMGARSLLSDGFEEALNARMEVFDSHGALYDTLKRRYLESFLEGREAAPPAKGAPQVKAAAPKGNDKINDKGQLTVSAIVDAIKKKQMLPDKLEKAFDNTNLAKQYNPPKRSPVDPSIASHDCSFSIKMMESNQIPDEIKKALDDPANGWVKKGGAGAGGAGGKQGGAQGGQSLAVNNKGGAPASGKGGKGKRGIDDILSAIYARDAYAYAEADPYADPEAFAEPEDYYEFDVRDAEPQQQSTFEELWAREALPVAEPEAQNEEFFQQIWTRDADAEPEYIEEYWTRDAEPEYFDESAFDLYAREDDGDVEARDAEYDELLARDALYDALLDVYA